MALCHPRCLSQSAPPPRFLVYLFFTKHCLKHSPSDACAPAAAWPANLYVCADVSCAQQPPLGTAVASPHPWHREAFSPPATQVCLFRTSTAATLPTGRPPGIAPLAPSHPLYSSGCGTPAPGFGDSAFFRVCSALRGACVAARQPPFSPFLSVCNVNILSMACPPAHHG